MTEAPEVRLAKAIEKLGELIVAERKERKALERIIIGKDGLLYTQGRILTQLRFQWWVLGIGTSVGTSVTVALAWFIVRFILGQP